MKNRIKNTGVILTCFMTIFAFYAFYLDRKGEDASTVGQNEIKILISESNEYLYRELRSLQQSTATRAMTLIIENRNLDETWKNVKYSFVNDELINPLIVQELIGWMSDPAPTITQVDLEVANQSNRFHGEFSTKKVDGKLWVYYEKDDRSFFYYRLVGISPSGIHILECAEGGGGSGVFNSIVFLRFAKDEFLDVFKYEGKTNQRLLLNIIGSAPLGDRYRGNVSYSEGKLFIGEDLSSKRFGERFESFEIYIN